MNKIKWHLLITSLFPLWTVIIFKNLWIIVEKICNIWNHNSSFGSNLLNGIKINCISLIFTSGILIICTISCLSINKFIKQSTKYNAGTGRITNIRKNFGSNNTVPLAMILICFFPLILFDFTSLVSIALFVIYIIFLGLIYIKYDYIYLNIFLQLEGYTLYKADIEYLIINKPIKYIDSLIISKNSLIGCENEKIAFYDFNRKIYLDVTKNDEL